MKPNYNRKDITLHNTNLNIKISPFGNKILDITPATYTVSDCSNLLRTFPDKAKALECDTYEKVLKLLLKIKNDSFIRENNIIVDIEHYNNYAYEQHHFGRNKVGCIHKENIDEMIAFVAMRQSVEYAAKENQIHTSLNRFKSAIDVLEKKLSERTIASSSDLYNKLHNIRGALFNLYVTLTFEIYSDNCYPTQRYYPFDIKSNAPKLKGPNLNETNYPLIINHFTNLTHDICKYPEKITETYIEKSRKELFRRLEKKPLSEKLEMAIGAVLGAALGFTVGGIMAGIPGAIAGAVGGAMLGGTVGFFHGWENTRTFKTRQNEKKSQEIAENTMTNLKRSV